MHSSRRIVGSLVALCAVATVSTARADAGRKIAIIVDGPGAGAIADGVGAHIESPNTVRPGQPVRAALAAHGSKSFAAAATNTTRGAQLIARAKAAAAQANVDVAILVSLRKAHGGNKMHVWVVDTQKDDAVVDKDVALDAAASTDDEANAVWEASSDAVGTSKAAVAAAPAPDAKPRAKGHAAKAAAPPPEAETPAAAPDEEKDKGVGASKTAAEPGRGRENSMLIAQAAVAVGARHFSYNQRRTAQLRTYDLTAAPLAELAVEVYPLAGSDASFARGLGITGGYSRAIGLASAEPGGGNIGTTWQNFDVGVRERLILNPDTVLGIAAGYGGSDFTFDQPANTGSVLPSVAYRFIRAGLDVRYFVGSSISLFGSGMYIYPLSAGQVGNYFPRATMGGLEAGLGAAYALGQNLEISLGVKYDRFYYSFNPVPGDANVAGGAVDEMEQVAIGLGYML
jgi:hypothetical protein